MLERTINNGLSSYRFKDMQDLTTQQKSEIVFNRLYTFFYTPSITDPNVWVDQESLIKTYYLKGQTFQDYTIETSKEYYLNELVAQSSLNTLCLAQGRVINVEPLNISSLGKRGLLDPFTFEFKPNDSQVLSVLMWNSLSTLQIKTAEGITYLRSYVISYSASNNYCTIRGF